MLGQALGEQLAHALAQGREALGLAAQRGRPVAHRPAVRAEHAPHRQAGHRFERSDERGEILVVAQVPQPLGQEEVPGEEPSPVALEEARVVRAVARRGRGGPGP